MAKHIVFLIHGMGAYVDNEGKLDPSWHRNAAESLRTAAESQNTLAHLGADELDSAVEFVPIIYDKLFFNLARNWEKNAEALSKFRGFSALADLFTGAGELKGNFFWTHAADVMMYFSSSIVRRTVVEEVKGQILDRLEDDTIAHWSVIGHSLGTAVAHDAVDDFIREYHVELDRGWYTPPQLIGMIANVSRVLQRPGTSVYDSYAAPKITGCKAFLTADHVYDPFTWPRPFRPIGKPWNSAQEPFGAFRFFDPTGLGNIHLPDDLDPDDVVDSPVQFILRNSPHNFDHYIANPRVHLPILAWLTGRIVTTAQVNTAATRYRAAQRSAAVDAIKEAMAEKVQEAMGMSGDDEMSVDELYGKLKALVEKWRLS